MTLLFVDGFERYTSAGGDTPTSKIYVGNNININNPGRFSYGQCGRFQGENPKWAMGAPKSDITMGFAMQCQNDAFSAGNRTIIEFAGNAGNNRQFSFASWSDGSVGIINNDDFGQVQCRSAAGVLQLSTWVYIELVLHHDAASDTGGSCTIYANGVSVATSSAAKMRANSNYVPDTLQMNFRFTTLVDDLYFAVDTQTPLGDCRVLALVPTSDASKAWTPSTGTTDYNLVDELPWNVSDYVSASVAGTTDTYGVADLPYTPATIFAVQMNFYAQKDDATARTIRSKLLSGASTVSGPTRTMNAGFAIFNDPPVVVDPATTAAWTASAINALQIGLEVVS